jgi:hypothetical protein
MITHEHDLSVTVEEEVFSDIYSNNGAGPMMSFRFRRSLCGPSGLRQPPDGCK